jgi:hypothetical protein
MTTDQSTLNPVLEPSLLAKKLQEETAYADLLEDGFLEVTSALRGIEEALVSVEPVTRRDVECLRCDVAGAMYWLAELDRELEELEQQNQ